MNNSEEKQVTQMQPPQPAHMNSLQDNSGRKTPEYRKELLPTVRKFFIDDHWLETHPKLIFGFVAIFIIAIIVFLAPKEILISGDEPVEVLEFVDVTAISPNQDKDKSEDDPNNKEVDQNKFDKIENLRKQAEDLSFFPNISAPRPIGRLKQYFPESARQQRIEATLYLELLIDASGKVRALKVLRGKLSKNLPTPAKTKMLAEFAKSARRSLLGQKFTVTKINGVPKPIITEFPLNFTLEI
jgi:outer membrane biosynthesis protein TonB